MQQGAEQGALGSSHRKSAVWPCLISGVSAFRLLPCGSPRLVSMMRPARYPSAGQHTLSCVIRLRSSALGF